MLRQVSGLVAALLMLHLVMARADTVCPMHQLMHGENAMPMGDPGAHGVPLAPGRVPMGGHHGPCNEPGLPPCCQGMCSCVVVAPAGATRTTERAALPDAPSIAVETATSVGAPAPEPPPPKG